jgi:hypothetical protein
MNFLVTLIRFPIGLVAGIFTMFFWLICFILETILAIFALLVLAIITNRREIEDSWLSTYPNSAPIRRTISAWSNIAEWIGGDNY